MNRTSINRSWLGRGGVVVVLLGLLLSSCESLLISGGLRPGGDRGTPPVDQGGTALKALPTGCFEVDADGAITTFDEKKEGCDLTEFAIPSKKDDSTSVTAIGENAFKSKGLTKLSIPNGVEMIGENAFHTNMLRSLSIPNSVEMIGENAFANNPNLVSVTLDPKPELSFEASSFPDDLWRFYDTQDPKQAGTWTWGGTPPSWTFSSLPADCFTVDNGTITKFLYTQAGCNLTEFVIPSVKDGTTIIAIGKDVFKTRFLTSITIPNSVTSIGEHAFFNNQLTELTIPNSVTSIGRDAFRNNQLTSLSIPSSVISIGENAFAENQNLVSLTFLDTPNQGLDFDGAFPGDFQAAFNGQDPKQAGTWIRSGRAWAFVLPEACLSVDANGVIDEFLNTQAGCNLTEFAIPAKKGSIEITAIAAGSFTYTGGVPVYDGVFYNKGLTSLIIPDSVETIGSWAFRDNQLTSLSLGTSVKTIGAYAFTYNQLTSLSIGNSVTSIGFLAFANNPNLVTIILDPNAELSFAASSFPNDLWTAFDDQYPKQAGTWTWDGSTWSFSN